MARPSIEPVTADILPAFADFLHQHLDRGRTPSQWADGLRARWAADQPNHGFVVRDNGVIVGGIGAYYADRLVDGQPHKLCNITSWCVLEAYRQQSMRLAMAVIGQPGYTFTDLSPTKVVGATLQFLKFKPLDDRQLVLPNLPWPSFDGLRLVHQPDQIASCLRQDGNSAMLQIFEDHRHFPWLRHVLLGRPGAWCHVVYKRRVFKGMEVAFVLHASDRALLNAGWRRLARHWLSRGLLISQVECRLLGRRPSLSAVRSGFNAKVFLSTVLQADQIDYLYSESVALDL